MNSKPIFAKHGSKQFFIDFFRLTLPPEGRLQSLAVLKVYDSATRERKSYLGASLLHPTDADVREIGFRLALCRAMDEAGLMREERSAVRSAVWESEPKELKESFAPFDPDNVLGGLTSDILLRQLQRFDTNLLNLFLYGNPYFFVPTDKLNSILPKGVR